MKIKFVLKEQPLKYKIISYNEEEPQDWKEEDED